MSIVLQGSTSGSITLQEPAVAGTTVLTLPATSGTVLISGTQNISRSALPTGSILQVVQTNYTGTVSSISATLADVSGFSASITPTLATSKILVMVTIYFGFNADAYPYVILKRNGTTIGSGINATGNQTNVFLAGPNVSGINAASEEYKYIPASKNFLDSPATTSALTYQIAFAQPWQGHLGYINRQHDTANDPYVQSTTSTITLMEVSA